MSLVSDEQARPGATTRRAKRRANERRRARPGTTEHQRSSLVSRCMCSRPCMCESTHTLISIMRFALSERAFQVTSDRASNERRATEQATSDTEARSEARSDERVTSEQATERASNERAVVQSCSRFTRRHRVVSLVDAPIYPPPPLTLLHPPTPLVGHRVHRLRGGCVRAHTHIL